MRDEASPTIYTALCFAFYFYSGGVSNLWPSVRAVIMFMYFGKQYSTVPSYLSWGGRITVVYI